MRIILHWLLSALAVIAAAYLIPGITLSGFSVALIVALVLGLFNAVIRPVLILLTLPIQIITLGLFTLVINALLVMLTSAVVPGFAVAGFWTALFFSLVLSLLNMIFDSIGKEKQIEAQ